MNAKTDEGSRATLFFEAGVSRRLGAEASVKVSVRDGMAMAGADCTTLTRMLVFASGEILKTVEVPVPDDAHDEGRETMTLALSDASGAPIADLEGITIMNWDPVPWA